MILTKRDLKFYLSEDARALGYDKLPFVKRFIRVHFDKRIKFHIELRKFEYYSNKFAKQNRGANSCFFQCTFIIILSSKGYPIF